ncbi:MAG TPA: hypothetical protein VGB00_04995, partial [Pyrinomonadaceae bacterium]
PEFDDEFTSLVPGSGRRQQATTAVVMEEATGVEPDNVEPQPEELDEFAMSEVGIDEIGAGFDEDDDNF